jgi:hypothetical protein
VNGKQARKIRKMVDCDLGKDTDCKQSGFQETGTKLIGIISHDGNHGSREESILEARTTEERYLYRELKKVYSRRKINPEIRKNLVKDLAELTAKTKTAIAEGGSNE